MKVSRILMVLLLGVTSSLAAGTKTTTSLSSSQNPSIYGQAVTFTAVVTPQPPDGETVSFMRGATVLGTGLLSGGTAILMTSALPEGTGNVKAVYAGDSNFAGSTSNAVSQVVSKATTTTTLVSSQNPSNVGQSVAFTASVAPEFSGTPTGSVAFYNGSTKLGTAALSGGLANYTTAKLAAGTDSITAVYAGSSSFTTSTSSVLSQTVGSGTFIDSTMTWDTITRYYEVFVPAALPANPPMVLMLHGTRYTATFDPQAVISLDWGWSALAAQYGFILVQPASTWDQATTQWNWNAYFMDASFPPPAPGTCTEPPATGCPDDAGFLRSLIVTLSAQYSVNPNQVYVTGFSSGAQMTERVGVEISDLVAAIAPTSGQMEGQQTAPPPVLLPPNPPTNPISVQEWAGTLDQNLWPCGYGTTVYSAITYYLDTVDDTFNYWAGTPQNSCTTLQTAQTLCANNVPNNANDAPTPGMPGMTGNIATGCTQSNIEVQFIWEPNVGHSNVPKNDLARWLFFAAHPKQPPPSR
jgi:poly(3-hydroxybutyrate) depolymerase